jgi:hypothetical protein
MDTLEARQQKDKQTYYRLLLNLLAEEVRRFFKRNDQEPSPRVAELVRDIDGREVETSDTYLNKAKAAERAAELASDGEAKLMFQSAAERWRQLARHCSTELEQNKESDLRNLPQ